VSPQAAKELLDLIMIDEYVARKKALDNWSRRWIATMQLDYEISATLEHAYGARVSQEFDRIARQTLISKMTHGLLTNDVPALRWSTSLIEGGRSLRVEMHVVLQEPRVLT